MDLKRTLPLLRLANSRNFNTLAKGGDVKVYKVHLFPDMSMHRSRFEKNEKWFNALLVLCNIDPSTVIRHPNNDEGMWFQAPLGESQLKQLRKLAGCKSAKEIPEGPH
uniref:uncharacterized protein LOC122590459 n=1 Tax=Erigeron canadensis TaxID=72917 RepID=UPI001CB8B710|nr:uncharacterized protein LOC122590459 [Erigeron canadensis]